MTVYQLALAAVMTAGSLLGAFTLSLFEAAGEAGSPGRAVSGPSWEGYAAIFILTSGMRVVTLFMLAQMIIRAKTCASGRNSRQMKSSSW